MTLIEDPMHAIQLSLYMSKIALYHVPSPSLTRHAPSHPARPLHPPSWGSGGSLPQCELGLEPPDKHASILEHRRVNHPGTRARRTDVLRRPRPPTSRLVGGVVRVALVLRLF